jgi:hypothetical protein
MKRTIFLYRTTIGVLTLCLLGVLGMYRPLARQVDESQQVQERVLRLNDALVRQYAQAERQNRELQARLDWWENPAAQYQNLRGPSRITPPLIDGQAPALPALPVGASLCIDNVTGNETGNESGNEMPSVATLPPPKEASKDAPTEVNGPLGLAGRDGKE